jgi:hypothetical protein
MTLIREISSSAAQLDGAIDRATEALVAKQAPGGWWVGELQGDSILESEYLLLKWIIGQESDPDLPKIANYLRGLQNTDAGWVAGLVGDGEGVFCAQAHGRRPECAAYAKGPAGDS